MIKLLSKSAFNKGQVLPFIINKEFKKNPEGNYAIYFYSKQVLVKDETSGKHEKKFRFIRLNYEGQPALFNRRKDAIEAARYRLGL